MLSGETSTLVMVGMGKQLQASPQRGRRRAWTDTTAACLWRLSRQPHGLAALVRRKPATLRSKARYTLGVNSPERPLCILVTGEPVPATLEKRGTFAQLLQKVVGSAWSGEWLVVDCRSKRPLPAPDALAGLVVTGSPHSVPDREPWVLEGETWLRGVVTAGVPVLGVCFGHQMLAQALGGRVARNPRGREIGTVEFEVRVDDPLLSDAERPYRVNMSHVDTVVEPPPGAQILGGTELDACAALRFAERVWGVQFHPEFDREIVGHYAMTRAELLREEGLDPEGIAAAATDAPTGARVLRRFVDLLNS